MQFINLTNRDGLSTSWVRSIYQDKYGFIWFATRDGLNRYDGYNFKVYKPVPDSANTLVFADVLYIGELNDTLAWVCTSRGVNILDLNSHRFLPFPYLNNNRVNHVCNDNEGNFWFSTIEGVTVYNQDDSSYVDYNFNKAVVKEGDDNQIYKCYQDSYSRMWVTGNKGVFLFDSETKKFNSLEELAGLKPLGNLGRDVLQINDSIILLGYEDEGVYRITNYNGRLSNIRITHLIEDLPTNALLLSDEGKIWIGHKTGKGISIIDLEHISEADPKIISIANEADKKQILADNTIFTLYKDKEGGVWVGTYAGGASYYNPYVKRFSVGDDLPGEIEATNGKVIRCFLRDGNTFWIGSEGGLFKHNLITKENIYYQHDPNDPSSIGADGVLCLFKDSYNKLWIGTWNGGLNQYDYSTGTFIRYMNNGTSQTPNSDNVFSIAEDSEGNLWLGTNGGGLNVFDRKKGRYRYYLPENGNEKSLYNNSVSDILIANDGTVYLSVYHSFEVFNKQDESFEHYIYQPGNENSISEGSIIDIFQDSRANIWVATTSGINLFNKDNKTFTRFGIDDGLLNNTILGIAEDEHGNLWMSSTTGLSQFEDAINNPDSVIIRNYRMLDGLKQNEFVGRSTYTSEQGYIYFGGNNGYSYFKPENIKVNPNPPKLAIVGFSMFDKGGKTLNFTKDINLIDQLDLDYFQNDFIIEYTALNFLNSEKNQFKYTLDGYETEWHVVGNQRVATYTNIDPGKYTFKVLGSNNDGVWASEPKTILINIRPPFWETLPFKISLILFISGLIYYIYRLRINQLSRQKRILEETVGQRTSELSELNSLLEERQEEITLQNEELTIHRHNLEKLVDERTTEMQRALKRAEEADKLKSAFLANMSHEIRTPMNAIVGFAALLNSEDLSVEEREEFTSIISNNCDTLMVLINDILEISLIEANQLKLKKDEFDAVQLLSELESYFKLNNQKPIEIKFQRNNKIRKLHIENDPVRFRQVVTNLLSNAYKYTEKGTITFGCDKKDGHAEFFVEDTGIGIDESEYDNIFNFFHKIDKGDNQLYRGAGIGLSISNKLVEIMGGKIWLSSQVGKGTKFTFSLPVKEDSNLPEKTTRRTLSKRLSISKNATIIIAEDDRNNYELVAKILKSTGATLLWAKNGKEAVQCVLDLSKQDNCLVIMDIKMPIMNGINAAKQILSVNPKIPIIAVTAYAQAQNKEDLLKNYFVDYISKPLNPDKLMETVKVQFNSRK